MDFGDSDAFSFIKMEHSAPLHEGCDTKPEGVTCTPYRCTPLGPWRAPNHRLDPTLAAEERDPFEGTTGLWDSRDSSTRIQRRVATDATDASACVNVGSVLEHRCDGTLRSRLRQHVERFVRGMRGSTAEARHLNNLLQFELRDVVRTSTEAEAELDILRDQLKKMEALRTEREAADRHSFAGMALAHADASAELRSRLETVHVALHQAQVEKTALKDELQSKNESIANLDRRVAELTTAFDVADQGRCRDVKKTLEQQHQQELEEMKRTWERRLSTAEEAHASVRRRWEGYEKQFLHGQSVEKKIEAPSGGRDPTRSARTANCATSNRLTGDVYADRSKEQFASDTPREVTSKAPREVAPFLRDEESCKPVKINGDFSVSSKVHAPRSQGAPLPGSRQRNLPESEELWQDKAETDVAWHAGRGAELRQKRPRGGAALAHPDQNRRKSIEYDGRGGVGGTGVAQTRSPEGRPWFATNRTAKGDGDEISRRYGGKRVPGDVHWVGRTRDDLCHARDGNALQRQGFQSSAEDVAAAAKVTADAFTSGRAIFGSSSPSSQQSRQVSVSSLSWTTDAAEECRPSTLLSVRGSESCTRSLGPESAELQRGDDRPSGNRGDCHSTRQHHREHPYGVHHHPVDRSGGGVDGPGRSLGPCPDANSSPSERARETTSASLYSNYKQGHGGTQTSLASHSASYPEPFGKSEAASFPESELSLRSTSCGNSRSRSTFTSRSARSERPLTAFCPGSDPDWASSNSATMRSDISPESVHGGSSRHCGSRSPSGRGRTSHTASGAEHSSVNTERSSSSRSTRRYTSSRGVGAPGCPGSSLTSASGSHPPLRDGDDCGAPSNACTSSSSFAEPTAPHHTATNASTTLPEVNSDVLSSDDSRTPLSQPPDVLRAGSSEGSGTNGLLSSGTPSATTNSGISREDVSRRGSPSAPPPPERPPSRSGRSVRECATSQERVRAETRYSSTGDSRSSSGHGSSGADQRLLTCTTSSSQLGRSSSITRGSEAGNERRSKQSHTLSSCSAPNARSASWSSCAEHHGDSERMKHAPPVADSGMRSHIGWWRDESIHESDHRRLASPSLTPSEEGLGGSSDDQRRTGGPSSGDGMMSRYERTSVNAGSPSDSRLHEGASRSNTADEGVSRLNASDEGYSRRSQLTSSCDRSVISVSRSSSGSNSTASAIRSSLGTRWRSQGHGHRLTVPERPHIVRKAHESSSAINSRSASSAAYSSRSRSCDGSSPGGVSRWSGDMLRGTSQELLADRAVLERDLAWGCALGSESSGHWANKQRPVDRSRFEA